MATLPMASKAAGAFDKALAFSDKKVAGMTWLKKIPIVKNAAPRYAADARRSLHAERSPSSDVRIHRSRPSLDRSPPPTRRRLTVSLAESLMFRGAIKPITFGGKLYLSYKFVMWGKERTTKRMGGGLQPACLSLSLPAPDGVGASADVVVR